MNKFKNIFRISCRFGIFVLYLYQQKQTVMIISQKRYAKIKQNLEFIFSDIADATGGTFSESIFKIIDRSDIDFILKEEIGKYVNPHHKKPFIAMVEYLNRNYFLILGVSKEAVIKYCYSTDKFDNYKF